MHLLYCIHNYITTMYIKFHAIRKTIQATQGRPMPMRVRPVWYPQPSHRSAFHFTCKPSLHNASRYLRDKQPIIHGLARVVQHLQFVAVDGQKPGMRWPELYLISQLATGLNARQIGQPSAKVRISMHRRLLKFKSEPIRLLKFMLSPEEQLMFKTSKMPATRLRAYG